MAPNASDRIPSPHNGADYVTYETSATGSSPKHHADLLTPAEEEVTPRWTMYSSAFMAVLFGCQYGWSIGQLNLSTFNDADECSMRPVPEGQCLMFPGHSKLEWTFVVNAWLLGGMVGALTIGHFAFKYGPKTVLRANAFVMIASAVLQASSFNVWQFVVGRFVAGLATGATTGVVPGYLSEIAPPRIRSAVGVAFQISLVACMLLVVITFFFANTSSGWRYIGAFPAVLAIIFLAFSPFFMVDSPVWLLVKGRRDEAERELATLYGKEHVATALGWIESTRTVDGQISSAYSDLSEELVRPVQEGNTPSLFAPEMRLQLIAGLGLVIGRQLTGLNAIYYYSSNLFQDAGIEDGRIGTVIINSINVIPVLFAGSMATRFGATTLLLYGTWAMFISFIGITVAFAVDISALSIVFCGTFVFAAQLSHGPFVWTVSAAVFPDNVRATAMAVCIGAHFLANLIVGVGYPYLSSAIGDYRMVPFVVCMVFMIWFLMVLVPETTGKTTDEIQDYFADKRKAKRVPRSSHDVGHNV